MCSKSRKNKCWQIPRSRKTNPAFQIPVCSHSMIFDINDNLDFKKLVRNSFNPSPWSVWPVLSQGVRKPSFSCLIPRGQNLGFPDAAGAAFAGGAGRILKSRSRALPTHPGMKYFRKETLAVDLAACLLWVSQAKLAGILNAIPICTPSVESSKRCQFAHQSKHAKHTQN